MYYSWLYTRFLYMDGCDHTMGPYIYDDDDLSILGACIHTLDLRLPNDHFHSDGCTHTVDLFTWSFLSVWLHPYHGFMFWYIRQRYHICICICILDFQVSQWCFVLILAIALKAYPPSLLAFPSCFRGHMLHSLLSNLLHFPVLYSRFPKTWQLCSVPILLCSQNHPWRTNEKFPWAFPNKISSKS